MRVAIEEAEHGPELLPMPAVASKAADEVFVNVRAKGASWLSVVADRRSGGGARITIDSDGKQVLAEVTVCGGESRAEDEMARKVGVS
jgi:hypothetical protein